MLMTSPCSGLTKALHKRRINVGRTEKRNEERTRNIGNFLHSSGSSSDIKFLVSTIRSGTSPEKKHNSLDQCLPQTTPTTIEESQSKAENPEFSQYSSLNDRRSRIKLKAKQTKRQARGGLMEESMVWSTWMVGNHEEVRLGRQVRRVTKMNVGGPKLEDSLALEEILFVRVLWVLSARP